MVAVEVEGIGRLENTMLGDEMGGSAYHHQREL